MSSILQQWSEKLGIPIDELTKKVEAYKANLKKLYPDKSDEWIHARAMGVLGAQLSTLLRSPAKPYKALVFGFSTVRDLNARLRREALDLFKEDPDKAIMEGYVMLEDGKPVVLDTRRELGGRPNPRFGRPLRPVYARTVVGLCQPYTGGPVKLFNLLDRHAHEQELALGKTYLFRANLRREESQRRIFTSSVVTQFQEIEPFLDQDVVTLLQNAPAEFKCSPIDLEEWHSKYGSDPYRVVIVEGDVLLSRDQPTETGNKIMSVGDVMEDMDFPGVTVFVPPHCDVFPTGSRVIVVGMTTLGRDIFTGERTRIILNAYGVYPVFVPSEEFLEVMA